jgi:hypothetical protein
MKFITVVLIFVSMATGRAQSQWQTKQGQDAFRGTSFTEFRLEGKYLAAPANGDATPSLLLRCVPGERGHGRKYDGKLLDGFLFVGQAVVEAEVSYDNSSRVETQYRLDDGKVHTAYLYHSKNFKSVSLKAPFCGECIIEDLLYGHQMPHKEGSGPQVKKVVLSIPEYLGANVVIEFDLPDSSEVASACGISFHK